MNENTQNDNEAHSKSEWAVCVVEIHGLEPIPGADSVELARFGDDRQTWDYPVVVRRGDFAVGDCAVYIPVDAVLPNMPEFAFVGSRRLRAKKIRGVYSEGLLISEMDAATILVRNLEAVDPKNAALLQADDETYKIHWDAKSDEVFQGRVKQARIALQSLEAGTECLGLGIERYTQKKREELSALGIRIKDVDETIPIFGCGNIKKGEADRFIEPDDRVIVSEKLHGCSFRFGFIDGGLYLGTHRRRLQLNADGTFTAPNNERLLKALETLWNSFILESLRENGAPNVGYYGEVFGPGIQDLTYGVSSPRVRIFGTFDKDRKVWQSCTATVVMAHKLNIDIVPVLAEGPWAEVSAMIPELAEGETTMNGAKHLREGVVVRVVKEVEGLSPRQFKYVGKEFRLRKGGTDNEVA